MSDIVFIRRNLKGMSVSGLWDYYHFNNPFKNTLFKIYGKIVFFFFVVFNTTEFIEMYNVVDDIPLLMGNAGVSLLYGVTCLKAYTVHYRKNPIKKLLDQIRSKEKEIFHRDDKQIRIYNQNIDQNWFVTKLFWFVCSSTLIAFYIARPVEFAVLGPQHKDGYKIPFVFSSWFPFNKFAPGYYSLAYTIQIISGIIGAYYIAIVDTFIVACMIFAISQFRLVQDNIERLHEKITDNSDPYFLIVRIVEEHNENINFLFELDDLIKTIIFVNFLTCSLLICAVGLEGIMSGPSVRLGLNVYYLIALLIQLFLFYWHGNEVSLESMNVGHAVARSQWYRFPKRVKQALLMMMVRSQKPCTLSVGGFYSMSLSTFLLILKTTYSFLALFRKVYSRQDGDD